MFPTKGTGLNCLQAVFILFATEVSVSQTLDTHFVFISEKCAEAKALGEESMVAEALRAELWALPAHQAQILGMARPNKANPAGGAFSKPGGRLR